MNWIDIVFIAILVVFAIIGLWRGLFDSLLGLISSGVALAIAIFTAKPVAKFLNKILKIDAWFLKIVNKAVGESGTVSLFGSEKLTFTSQEVAQFLSIVFAVIVTFVLIKLAVWLLAKLFDSVTSSTIGSGLNKVLGFFFGLCRGAVFVILALSLCCVFSSTKIIGNSVQENNDNTKNTKNVYKYVSDYIETSLEKTDIKEYVSDLVKGQTTSSETTPEATGK